MALVTGLLVLGEALALVVGVRFADPTDPWVTTQHDLLLSLDVLVGGMLCWVGTRSSIEAWPDSLGTLLLVAVCVHIYRLWQVVAGVPNPYATGDALAATTVLKLLAVGTLFVAFAAYRADRSANERAAGSG